MNDNIIKDHERLIYSIMRYFKFYPHREDLYQAGCVGLIDAYKHYDISFNTKFTTFAYTYILGEMKRLVREDRSVKVSREIQSLYLKIEKVSLLLSQKLMREPTIKEISEFLGIDEDMVIESYYSNIQTLDIEDHPIARCDNVDEYLCLKESMKLLDSREQVIIEDRYMKDKKQQEIAEELGMSQVQVSRVERGALKKLKKQLVA